jgi:hypothetical protein
MNQTQKAKEKETILTICTALVFLFLVSKGKQLPALYVAVVLGAVGMFSDYLTAKIHGAWMKLAEGMGWVMSKIILGIVFFLFLFPIALLSRITGKSSMQLKRRNGSYFIARNHTYTKKDLEHVW